MEEEALLRQQQALNRPQKSEQQMSEAIMNVQAMLAIDDIDKVIKLLEGNDLRGTNISQSMW